MRHYSLKAVMEVKKKFSIHISRPILHLLRPYFLLAKVQTMIKGYLFTPRTKRYLTYANENADHSSR